MLLKVFELRRRRKLHLEGPPRMRKEVRERVMDGWRGGNRGKPGGRWSRGRREREEN